MSSISQYIHNVEQDPLYKIIKLKEQQQPVINQHYQDLLNHLFMEKDKNRNIVLPPNFRLSEVYELALDDYFYSQYDFKIQQQKHEYLNLFLFKYAINKNLEKGNIYQVIGCDLQHTNDELWNNQRFLKSLSTMIEKTQKSLYDIYTFPAPFDTDENLNKYGYRISTNLRTKLLSDLILLSIPQNAMDSLLPLFKQEIELSKNKTITNSKNLNKNVGLISEFINHHENGLISEKIVDHPKEIKNITTKQSQTTSLRK